MKRLNSLLIFGILAALILVMVTVVPASAYKPVHYRVVWEADFPDETCVVPLQAHIEVANNNFIWFDKDGNSIGDTWNGVSRGYWTNEGRIVRTIASGKTTTTYLGEQDGIAKIKVASTGTEWKASVPGHGIVTGTVGNFTYTATCVQVGENEWNCEMDEILKWSGMDFGDSTVLCNYLLYGE